MRIGAIVYVHVYCMYQEYMQTMYYMKVGLATMVLSVHAALVTDRRHMSRTVLLALAVDVCSIVNTQCITLVQSILVLLELGSLVYLTVLLADGETGIESMICITYGILYVILVIFILDMEQMEKCVQQ